MKHKPVLGHITECQICASKDLRPILHLGHQAPVHAHLTAEQLHEPETRFPLNLYQCQKCKLTQIDYAADPKVIFYPNYPYNTGTTNMLVRNFLSLRDVLVEKFQLQPKDLVIDIGSNDGTLLQGFKKSGMRVLGIEPTNVAKLAQRNGIPTMQKFFNKAAAKEIVKKYGKAKIITATNVFAHVNNLFELMEGVEHLLDKDGVFVSESQYFLDTVKRGQLDCIYHEHLRYYALLPLTKLFSLSSMSITDAEHIESAGGSLRIYAMKGKKLPSERVKKLINIETKEGIYDLQRLREFAKQALSAKHELHATLLQCKKEGGRIAGIGAPGRSNTLLQFMGIGNTFLDYACERDTSPKIGLLTPGTHIPIKDEKVLFDDQPEYGLLLSWHIGDELMKKLRARGYKGKFITPLPTPRIITEI